MYRKSLKRESDRLHRQLLTMNRQEEAGALERLTRRWVELNDALLEAMRSLEASTTQCIDNRNACSVLSHQKKADAVRILVQDLEQRMVRAQSRARRRPCTVS
jgi:hypothetical protein